jgi:gluconolactonase
MWNLTGLPPDTIESTVRTRLPDELRRTERSAWADANKAGAIADCFLEGPAFDRAGNLYLVDIPHGRIFRVSPEKQWTQLAEYDGWPNGLAVHTDGSVWIADYRKGLLRLDPASGRVETVLGHRNSESFKGLNDLTFDTAGNLYFTDQGQTGMHDASGRVYRLRPNGQLDLLLANAPSPNGLVVAADDRTLFLAVTRANQVWRVPLLADGSVSKVGVFQNFFGTSGPDGMCLSAQGQLVVAHASLGAAFVLAPNGAVTHVVRSAAGNTVTNVAFVPGTATVVMTESSTGTVLEAQLPGDGQSLFSHAPWG